MLWGISIDRLRRRLGIGTVAMGKTADSGAPERRASFPS
jgi:hypothetical protein